MRRYLAAALAAELAVAMLPSAALAQTGELNRDREDIRQAERDFDRAQRYGQPRHIDMRPTISTMRSGNTGQIGTNTGPATGGSMRAANGALHFITSASPAVRA